MYEASFLEHLEKLGLSSESDYIRWCRKNGFSTGINKSLELRAKEIQFVKEQALKLAIDKGKEKHKPLAEKIKNNSEFIDPQISKTMDTAKLDAKEAKAFLNFLSLVDNKSKLLSDKNIRFIPSFPAEKSNNILYALAKIFQHRQYWIKPLEQWSPSSKNIYKQFSQLLRHLFTPYAMPVFLDSAWFTLHPHAISWFLDIASGKNIRKSENLPVVLTKMQAHEFLQAPDTYDIFQALRYGQIMGMSEDKRLVEAVLEKPFGTTFEHDDFWVEVIRFFINNPMLDRREFSPLVDYINAVKFAPNAEHPGFSMKGRNPETLLTQVEQWHNKVSKERGKNYMEWKPVGLGGFTKEEKSRNEFNNWSIEELLNSTKLFEEGRVLSHCVSSYKYSAAKGQCSIWSLKLNDQKAITIEVNTSSQSIVQARGKLNRLPNSKEIQIIREWANKEGLAINCRGF